MKNANALEDLRKKKLLELQQSLQGQEEQEQNQQAQALIKKLLDPKAQERLGNIKAANPLLAEKIEALMLYLYQSGQLKGKITEDLFKQILSKLSNKRETKITRK